MIVNICVLRKYNEEWGIGDGGYVILKKKYYG